MAICGCSSQHGGYLRDRGWLQAQGTEFLQPFVKVASNAFQGMSFCFVPFLSLLRHALLKWSWGSYR